MSRKLKAEETRAEPCPSTFSLRYMIRTCRHRGIMFRTQVGVCGCLGCCGWRINQKCCGWSMKAACGGGGHRPVTAQTIVAANMDCSAVPLLPRPLPNERIFTSVAVCLSTPRRFALYRRDASSRAYACDVTRCVSMLLCPGPVIVGYHEVTALTVIDVVCSLELKCYR